MEELTISDELYRQLEAETEDEEIEDTIWEMVGMYRRARNPESDTE